MGTAFPSASDLASPIAATKTVPCRHFSTSFGGLRSSFRASASTYNRLDQALFRLYARSRHSRAPLRRCTLGGFDEQLRPRSETSSIDEIFACHYVQTDIQSLSSIQLYPAHTRDIPLSLRALRVDCFHRSHRTPTGQRHSALALGTPCTSICNSSTSGLHFRHIFRNLRKDVRHALLNLKLCSPRLRECQHISRLNLALQTIRTCRLCANVPMA